MRFRQRSLLGLRLGAFMTALALALLLGVGRSSAVGGAGSYTNVVFTDGFESGSLSNWNGLLGNGTASVVGAAAHSGSNGLRITNTSGQFQVAVKALPNPLVDSSVSFWVREASGSGLQQVAQARDGASSAARISAAVAVGTADASRPAAPATSGAAIDVPHSDA